MKLIYSLILTFLLASNSWASKTDFVQVGYQQVDVNWIASLQSKGVKVVANKEIGDFYLEASYFSSSGDKETQYENFATVEAGNFDVDYSVIQLKVGRIFELTELSNIDISIAYSSANFDGQYKGSRIITNPNNGSREEHSFEYIKDENSKNISLDLTYNVVMYDSFYFDFSIGGEHVQEVENKTNFTYGAEFGYWFSKEVQANVEYRDTKSTDSLSLNLLYKF